MAVAALTWIEADVAGYWSLKPMDIWHDRAVFHLLTEPCDRRSYVGHYALLSGPNTHWLSPRRPSPVFLYLVRSWDSFDFRGFLQRHGPPFRALPEW